jgi:hypothetical protein
MLVDGHQNHQCRRASSALWKFRDAADTSFSHSLDYLHVGGTCHCRGEGCVARAPPQARSGQLEAWKWSRGSGRSPHPTQLAPVRPTPKRGGNRRYQVTCKSRDSVVRRRVIKLVDCRSYEAMNIPSHLLCPYAPMHSCIVRRTL